MLLGNSVVLLQKKKQGIKDRNLYNVLVLATKHLGIGGVVETPTFNRFESSSLCSVIFAFLLLQFRYSQLCGLVSTAKYFKFGKATNREYV
ncbi:hypothetical protein AX774_g8214 [Zancudomyces culisetae]|uniref:Uncharacterized protein n=1 Tax=Zancudomyces culisetae TaxID=1213189 RepID=A0A1R1PBS2_ZANCU|nr:hypothetical protein AX774_g8214 [Zancudomyces culisetae]|eukprot:OMH78400.1 hypothetical protein AX774_g8214 [Zancudomyces culisetae]